MNQFIESTYIVHISILLLFTILSHGIILFNNGLYWDSWMVDSWQRRKDWITMKRYLSEVGMPFMYYVYKLNGYIKKRIFASRFLAIISLFISSVQIYIITTYFNLLNPHQALALAFLFLSYTGYHMIVDTVVGLQYTFPTAIFYTAVLLALYANTLNGLNSYLIHFIAVIFFFWSFNANSILVYYFGFLFLNISFQTNGILVSIIKSDFIIKNIIYLILPFIFWIIKEKFTPRHGYYKDYNKIRVNPLRILRGILYSARYSFESAIFNPIFFIFRRKFFILIIIFIIIFNYFFLFDFRISNLMAINFIILGIGLFILAVIPYILVGQPINENGWATKNAMLIHLPSGLIIYGISSYFFNDQKIFQSFILFYIISSCTYNIRNNLFYLSVFIKDYSWLYKLKHNNEIDNVKIFQIIDMHDVKGDLSNIYQDYKPVYLFYMFDWIWESDLSRFGISEFEPKDAYTRKYLSRIFEDTTIPYVLNNVDIDSRQARILIKNKSTSPFYIISIKYIFAITFNRKDQLLIILDNVTNIEIEFLN